MRILLLGAEGPGRRALAETLGSHGCAVTAAGWRPGRPLPPGGEVVVLDLREGALDGAPSAGELLADPRPLAVVCDRPREGIGALVGRPGGTSVLVGAESEAGYRVALRLCAGLIRAARANGRIPAAVGTGRAEPPAGRPRAASARPPHRERRPAEASA